ncbi:MAG TPA: hypothetical protein VGE75_05670 [Acidimicrobiales bacterium]|jgi:hypothetical protein
MTSQPEPGVVTSDDPVSDEELTALALAANPHAPLDPDAVPWRAGMLQMGLLPDWYMPRPIAAGRGRGTRIVICAVVVGFLVIGASGLCITSGFLSLA